MFGIKTKEAIQDTPAVTAVRGLVSERVMLANAARRKGRRKGLRDFFLGPYFIANPEVTLGWAKALPELKHNPELNGCASDYQATVRLFQQKKADQIRIKLTPNGNPWSPILDYALTLRHGEKPSFSYSVWTEDEIGVIPAGKEKGIAEESHLKGVINFLDRVTVRK